MIAARDTLAPHIIYIAILKTSLAPDIKNSGAIKTTLSRTLHSAVFSILAA
jgi:hypothetical protein